MHATVHGELGDAKDDDQTNHRFFRSESLKSRLRQALRCAIALCSQRDGSWKPPSCSDPDVNSLILALCHVFLWIYMLFNVFHPFVGHNCIVLGIEFAIGTLLNEIRYDNLDHPAPSLSHLEHPSIPPRHERGAVHELTLDRPRLRRLRTGGWSPPMGSNLYGGGEDFIIMSMCGSDADGSWATQWVSRSRCRES